MTLLSYLRTGVFLAAAILFIASGGTSRPAMAQGAGSGGASLAMAISHQSDEILSDQAVEVLPLSMRPFYHVFAAFGLAWLLIFGYAISLKRRVAALERDLDSYTS